MYKPKKIILTAGPSITAKEITYVSDKFTKVIGSQDYIRKANGLSLEQIVETIRATYEN